MKRYTIKIQPPKKFIIDYKSELNDQQYEVVVNADGPSLVLAGAGSGKTRTLVYRVAYLIEKGVNPENILLVTFTNKAAREMLERVENLLGYPPRGLWGGTFHHIANIILHKYANTLGIGNNFTIIDEEDARSLLKNITKEYGINKIYFPKPRVLKSIISYCINSQTFLKDYLENKYSRFGPEIVNAIEKINIIYKKRKLATNNLDFDDLLLYWLKLLENNKNVLKQLGAQFRYILVDEYQDTNRIQAKIMNLLASVHKNILVVGDDAQSIYSFRAAEVSNILDFPTQYKNAKIFQLSKNYRSRPEILDLATYSINKNKNQFRKNLSAHLDSAGKKPIYISLRDSQEQAMFIAQRVLELRDENIDLSHIAVLFRSAYQSLELELELNRRGIPYVMRGGLRFFEQAHIKDVVSFLKIYANPSDRLSWQRVLLMQEGVGPKGVIQIIQNLKDYKNIDELLRGDAIDCILTHRVSNRKSLKGLEYVLSSLQNMHKKQDQGLAAMIIALLKNGYSRYVEKMYENPQDRIEDIQQMAQFAGQKKIDEFLAEVVLSEGFRGELQRISQEGNEKLILSTIHQAKGLEWNTVFVIGLVHGQFPHHKVIENPKAIEEERRLFYVASTRAKENLYLTNFIFQYSAQIGSHIQHPSQFIEELDPQLLENWEVTLDDQIIDESGDGILDRVSQSRQKKKKSDEIEYVYE